MIQLRPYQIDIAAKAAELLRQYHIAYLAVEVRCGKTLMSLQAATDYGAERVLFVTKKKAISSIEKDYAALQPPFAIVITNYESVHKYESIHFDLVILDEAHCLGQFPLPAERTKVLKQLCEGLSIIYLSGTPTAESFSQIFHQFFVSSFSPFAKYKNFYKWAKEYVIIKKKYVFNRELNDYSHAKQHLIEAATKHLFLTYTQAEAGFKEEVKEYVLEVQMKPATYALAHKLQYSRLHIGKRGEEILADTAVKLMQKLHQVYSGTVLTEDKQAIIFDDSKARFIEQQFKGKKIAIYYKFTAEFTQLLHAFGDKLTLSPEEFNSRTDKWFVSQIQSGREGVNLSTADALVMYNIDFSAVSYQQVRARMQAKDRVKECSLYWLFSKDGIESRVYEAVMEKRDYTLRYFSKDYQLLKQPIE
jgi:superfamily II DNA or RNA helicase